MKINICGYEVLIDDEDYERVCVIKWRRTSAGPYFGTGKRINGKYKIVWLHRFIIDAPEGFEVDHINLDTLDNRKANLRVCTRAQNMHNRSKY
ncbi:MAG: HNH endonuclease, partial [Treponema sp.]|nr:HNH endonuclease [Treponema sp.]